MVSYCGNTWTAFFRGSESKSMWPDDFLLCCFWSHSATSVREKTAPRLSSDRLLKCSLTLLAAAYVRCNDDSTEGQQWMIQSIIRQMWNEGVALYRVNRNLLEPILHPSLKFIKENEKQLLVFWNWMLTLSKQLIIAPCCRRHHSYLGSSPLRCVEARKKARWQGRVGLSVGTGAKICGVQLCSSSLHRLVCQDKLREGRGGGLCKLGSAAISGDKQLSYWYATKAKLCLVTSNSKNLSSSDEGERGPLGACSFLCCFSRPYLLIRRVPE